MRSLKSAALSFRERDAARKPKQLPAPVLSDSATVQ